MFVGIVMCLGWPCLEGALDIDVEGQRKKGRSKRTWKMHVEIESVKVGLRREDALCRSMWIVSVNKIASVLRKSGHPHLFVILPNFNH